MGRHVLRSRGGEYAGTTGGHPGAKRASYIRVLMLELNRIANHLLWLGPFLADVGAQTFFYIFREREMIYDLWTATGQRLINNNYFRIGGVADLPGWLEKCRDFCGGSAPRSMNTKS